MKKSVSVIFITILIGFAGLNLMAFSMQERFIFFPEKLPANFRFEFAHPFEEVNFAPQKDVLINALWFKKENPKGVVYYLHGNAGSLRTWGAVYQYFERYNYDVIVIDYRGYGKSKGRINENGLYSDAQYIYDFLKEKYNENQIVVYGRSIGTGIASYLASKNNPGKLILETPYYNFTDLVKNLYPFAPTSLLKYKFPNNEYVVLVKCPICIFHGTKDEVVYYESSEKLKQFFKEGDEIISIDNGNHNNLSLFQEYHRELERILNK